MAPVNPEKRKDPPPKAKRTRKKQSKKEKKASKSDRNKEGYKKKRAAQLLQKDENLKKNDVCMNKQMQIRCSENLEVTNSMIARTNRIAKARLKFGSNDARKHLQRQKERITMKTMSRASWKRKSGHLQP